MINTTSNDELVLAATCNTSSLAPYVPTNLNEWDVFKIQHIYRRLGYGASYEQIQNALSQSPQQLVNTLFEEALNASKRTPPEFTNWTISDYTYVDDDEFNEILRDQRTAYTQDRIDFLFTAGFRGRLTFFWLNHFVTQDGDYKFPSYMHEYYDALWDHAFGNFKTFVHNMGLVPAMLLFLNNFENTKTRPNENYARELFELFTLGEDNGYTEEDILEASRAMTGYNQREEKGGPISFDPEKFDTGSKTIFGQRGNFSYSDVIDVLFEQKAPLIAQFICDKLYRFFVSPEINTEIINEMAVTFQNNNFEIEPVLRQLLSSQHFFDASAQGVVIKSPYDFTHQFFNETGFATNELIIERIKTYNDILGQRMFSPIDVAGWQRDRDWLNSSTLPARWLIIEDLLSILNEEDPEQFRKFAVAVSNNSTDVREVTKAIVNHFIAKELHTEVDYEVAIDIFKWENPENYYTEGIWNLQFESVPVQVRILLGHIGQIPEFQLK